MPTRAIDGTVIAGGLSSPAWLHAFTEIGQAVLVGLSIIVALLRVEAMIRARRKKSTSTGDEQ